LLFFPKSLQNNENRKLSNTQKYEFKSMILIRITQKKVIKEVIERTADRIRVNDLKALLLLQKRKKDKKIQKSASTLATFLKKSLTSLSLLLSKTRKNGWVKV
jgi:ABC-type antimicrobial peptide transport system ATPase subunit